MFHSFWGFDTSFLLAWLWPLAILDLVLKGFALWRSVKNNQPWGFIALLVLNTAGILPLIYLIVVDKKQAFVHLSKRFK